MSSCDGLSDPGVLSGTLTGTGVTEATSYERVGVSPG